MLKKCPELSDSELLIDKVVKRVLIQAKHYQVKKNRVGVSYDSSSIANSHLNVLMSYRKERR